MPHALAALDMASPEAIERIKHRRQHAAAVAARATAVASRVVSRRWPEAFMCSAGPVPMLPMRLRGDIVRRRLAEKASMRVRFDRGMRVPDYVPPPTTILYAASLMRNAARGHPPPPPSRNTEVGRGSQGRPPSYLYSDHRDQPYPVSSTTTIQTVPVDGKTIMRNTYKHYMNKTKSVRDGQGLMLDLAWREVEREGRERFVQPDVLRLRRKTSSAHVSPQDDDKKNTSEKQVKRHTSEESVIYSKDKSDRSLQGSRDNHPGAQSQKSATTAETQSVSQAAPPSRRPTKGALKLGTPKESDIRINAHKKSVHIVTPPKSPAAVSSNVSTVELTAAFDLTDEFLGKTCSAGVTSIAEEIAASDASCMATTIAAAAADTEGTALPAATATDNTTADSTSKLSAKSTKKSALISPTRTKMTPIYKKTKNKGDSSEKDMKSSDLKGQKDTSETHPTDDIESDSQRRRSGRSRTIKARVSEARSDANRGRSEGHKRRGSVGRGGVSRKWPVDGRVRSLPSEAGPSARPLSQTPTQPPQTEAKSSVRMTGKVEALSPSAARKTTQPTALIPCLVHLEDSEVAPLRLAQERSSSIKSSKVARPINTIKGKK